MRTFSSSRPVRPTLQRLSLWLLVTLLVTLLSPHFGWEMTTGGRAHDAVAMHDVAGTDCDRHDADEHGAHHHHGCAGHQFSHSPAQASAPPELSLASAAAILRGTAVSAFSSHIPPGLDRPPAAAHA